MPLCTGLVSCLVESAEYLVEFGVEGFGVFHHDEVAHSGDDPQLDSVPDKRRLVVGLEVRVDGENWSIDVG